MQSMSSNDFGYELNLEASTGPFLALQRKPTLLFARLATAPKESRMGSRIIFFLLISAQLLYQTSAQTPGWTWTAGNSAVAQIGVYGTKGIASINNRPGSRSDSVSVFDEEKNEFWLFGGLGLANNSTQGSLAFTPIRPQSQFETEMFSGLL